MKSKIKLNEGEELKLESSRSKGTLAETDIYNFLIVDKTGEIVGSVEHTDHTSIKGFNRTQHVIQKDLSGKVIVETSW